MQISSWLFRTIVSRFDSLEAKDDALSSELAEVKAMVQQLLQGQMKIMATMEELKTAEQAQGEKITSLITLTNSIFDKLGQSPVSNDPAVQEVLDMITQHNAEMDAAIARDTAPASTPAPQPAPADGTPEQPAA